jgi:hypothetical protein
MSVSVNCSQEEEVIYHTSNLPCGKFRLLGIIGAFLTAVAFASSIINESRIGMHIDGYEQHKNRTRQKKAMYCRWGPGKNTECIEELIPYICDTTMTQDRIGARILSFGDSTMSTSCLSRWVKERLKMLQTQPTCQFQCERKVAERCNNRLFFQFDNYMPQWIREPHQGREGPAIYGYQHHGCSDCVSAPHYCVSL